ncbi:MAG: flagellar biosynthetic protein FliP, partial [Aquificaceae bacterium]
DLVVASILISMGILMIPPQIISLPFKIMLFVLANGWELVVLSLVRSYQ